MFWNFYKSLIISKCATKFLQKWKISSQICTNRNFHKKSKFPYTKFLMTNKNVMKKLVKNLSEKKSEKIWVNNCA